MTGKASEASNAGEQGRFGMGRLYAAWRQCRRKKRCSINALRFELDLEDHLTNLHGELVAGIYRPNRSIAFLVAKPKRREIFAADFRDRVVHHLLVDQLEPYWERRFIHDSYACRQGKGIHAAVTRLQSFCRKATANETRKAWYLQLDIKGFFMSIDREILYERLAACETAPEIFWLLQVVIFNDPTTNFLARRTRVEEFYRLPEHKTLFKARPGCGLPIGNLTSQFFANVYLDALDQYIKRVLRCPFYIRYCDDMVLLAKDREELLAYERAIVSFLRDKLRLRLNNRCKLRPVGDGIDFLGYIVRPAYLLVRRRVVANLYERLRRVERELFAKGLIRQAGVVKRAPWPWNMVKEIFGWLASYHGHFSKASAHKLRARILLRFSWLTEYFSWKENGVAWRFPPPPLFYRFRAQCGWFARQLAGHLVMLQTGSYWRALGKTDTLSGVRCVHHCRISSVVRASLTAGTPVALVMETGERATHIAERRLAWRMEN